MKLDSYFPRNMRKATKKVSGSAVVLVHCKNNDSLTLSKLLCLAFFEDEILGNKGVYKHTCCTRYWLNLQIFNIF